MIMVQRGSNPNYRKLFSILEGYKAKVVPINRESDVKDFTKMRTLLILEKEAYENMNKFLISNRMEKNIDIAVLGFMKGFDKYKNFAIATDYPTEII